MTAGMTGSADVVIRPAVAGDLAAIVALCKTSLRATYGAFLDADKMAPWADGEELDKYARANMAHMLVAVDADGPVGVVAIEGDFVGLLWVAIEKRGQGIGSQLMIAAEARMRLDGHTRLRVNVFEPNVGAIRFYERHGWTKQGIEFEPNAGVNQVLMVKE